MGVDQIRLKDCRPSQVQPICNGPKFRSGASAKSRPITVLLMDLNPAQILVGLNLSRLSTTPRAKADLARLIRPIFKWP